MKIQTFCRYSWILVMALAGCVGTPIVPVSDLTTPRAQYSDRVVRSGDSLYMIAWEVGLDYRQLADWNSLTAPYRLVVGSRIRLTAPKGWKTNSNIGITEKSIVDSSELQSNSTTSSSKHTKLRWLWPTDGQVITKFTGKNANNGVDIAGVKGATVRAAATGIVVYAGSGLRGYGQLIIIQHNEVFLSAYAHNQALIVSEGVAVRRGQKIAEMGDTDTQSPRLHFEIRRNGAPVDPLDYLPNQSS